MRVPQFLSERHVSFDWIIHPPSFTAQKRAHLLHVPGRLLAKCVLLAHQNGFVLAILPATHEIDLGAVACRFREPMRLAASDEIAQIFHDCEWGVLSPFGTLYSVPTILDEAIDADALIVFESEMHAVSVRMRCRDFERLERPQRFPFARAVGPCRQPQRVEVASRL